MFTAAEAMATHSIMAGDHIVVTECVRNTIKDRMEAKLAVFDKCEQSVATKVASDLRRLAMDADALSAPQRTTLNSELARSRNILTGFLSSTYSDNVVETDLDE